MKKLIYINTVTALFILLFSYSSASKFLDYDQFVFQMKLAPLPFMEMIAPSVGVFLPILEAILCILLITRKWRQKALVSSVLLMILFEAYIAAMLSTGKDLPCTCGGIISTLGWKEHLFFNVIFIVGGLIAIQFQKQNLTEISQGSTKIFYAHKNRETVT